MSLPRYLEYKDSGLPLLGSIPAHWSAARLKEVIRSIESGVSVNATDVPAAEGAIGVLKTSCVYDGTFRFTENKAVVEEDLARVSCPVAEGTLIVSRMNTPALVGAAGLVTQSHPNIYLPDRLWQVSLRNSSPSFVHYWTLSGEYRAQVEVACSGTSSSMQNLGQDQFKNFQIALPVVDEQHTIATFLDRETAKIGALIAEQEKLLALLAEKRQATISHAVTRGLTNLPGADLNAAFGGGPQGEGKDSPSHPNAPMKDSGIPWLGEVPAHWRVTKCGRYLSILSGYAFPSAGFDHSGSGTKLLRGVNVSVGTLRWDDVVYWERSEDDGLDEYELRVGDIVIGMDRPLIAAGMRVARVEGADVPCLLLQRVALLRTSSELNSDFLMHWLSTPMFVAHFSPETTGVSVPHISPDQIASFVVALPSIDEQKKIIEFVNNELHHLTELYQQSEQAVELLKERRSALISAAVTGKIDVRHAA